nr:HNH endonuclease [Mucilaginibacter sp. L294]
MSRLYLKPTVVKRLFALSGNQCAFPNCQEKIVDEVGTVIGEICHIEAAEVGGERYNSESDDEFRRDYNNLILLCSNHHKKTNNVIEYPTSKLIEYKELHTAKFATREYTPTDSIIEQAINKYMEQNNTNVSSGSQFNNQANSQTIQSQIGTQNNFYDSSKNGHLKIDGARKVNLEFKKIIDQFKQKASPPSTEVIDFQNELKERIERPVEIIPTKHLRFRKNNGRIIAEVESHERESKNTLLEEDNHTQEILREFLLNNDKEENEKLKRLLSQKGQQRPAIITCDGFLINGNRRKMALEELFRLRNQDSQFEMMRVVILPEGVTELDIQKIENRYQLQSEGKSEYQGLNRAIKIQRNIDDGFSLQAQLRDDPNYYELPDKEFTKQVKKFEKEFLQPLKWVDKYLSDFDRQGMYNTISDGVSDKEGRWQAFIDYSNFRSGTLENKQRLSELKIKENEVGKIQDAVFKIIRKRNLTTKDFDLGKVHEFVRKLPKYLSNEDAKQHILKIADEVNHDIPEELKVSKDGERLSEREIDLKWGEHFREKIIGNLIQAHRYVVNQEERDKPLELLEDALKKLKHDNLKIENLGTDYYEKALELTQKIINEAEGLYKAVDDARFKLKKLTKNIKH